MNDIILSYHDDRLGYVDAQRNLVYPAFDVFGAPMPVRTSVQVVWIGERFVCFPANVNPDGILVAVLPEGYNPAEEAPSVIEPAKDMNIVTGDPIDALKAEHAESEPEAPKDPTPAKKKGR